MGRAVTELIDGEYRERCRLAASVSSQSQNLDALNSTDVVVDFSLPAGTHRLVHWLSRRDGPTPALVCGTTGLADEELGHLRRLGRTRPVLHANNFSSGLAAFQAALEFAAPVFGSLGYTPVITETHHVGKKDAPSGTAKVLQRTLDPATPESVQTHSVRTGTVIGEHQVEFHGPDDRITFSHTALNRALFARGALEAALWLCSQKRNLGFLTMRDYFRARFSSADTFSSEL